MIVRTAILVAAAAVCTLATALPAAADDTVHVVRDRDGRTTAEIHCSDRDGRCAVRDLDGRTLYYVEDDGYGGTVLRDRDGRTVGEVEPDWRSGSSWRDGPSWRD